MQMDCKLYCPDSATLVRELKKISREGPFWYRARGNHLIEKAVRVNDTLPGGEKVLVSIPGNH